MKFGLDTSYIANAFCVSSRFLGLFTFVKRFSIYFFSLLLLKSKATIGGSSTSLEYRCFEFQLEVLFKKKKNPRCLLLDIYHAYVLDVRMERLVSSVRVFARVENGTLGNSPVSGLSIRVCAVRA